MKLRKLWKHNHADLGMIITAIIMAIGFAIGIIVVYNILPAIDSTTIDNNLATNLGENTTHFTDVANATSDLTTNINTFYTVGPIALIVVAAVGILSYVLLLRRGR